MEGDGTRLSALRRVQVRQVQREGVFSTTRRNLASQGMRLLRRCVFLDLDIAQ